MFEISDIDIKNEIKWNRKNGIVPEEAKTDFFPKSLISSQKFNYIEIKKAGNLLWELLIDSKVKSYHPKIDVKRNEKARVVPRLEAWNQF